MLADWLVSWLRNLFVGLVGVVELVWLVRFRLSWLMFVWLPTYVRTYVLSYVRTYLVGWLVGCVVGSCWLFDWLVGWWGLVG